MRPLHILMAVLVMTIWGLNFVAAKLGLTELPPLLLTGVRFALVALMLLPFATFPKGQGLKLALLSLVMGSLHFGFMFTGLTQVNAGVAAIAIQLQVPFAALIAAIVFKDYLGWRRLLGMAVAFAGVVLLAGEPEFDADIGYLLLVVAASLMWAVGNLIIKSMGEIDGFSLNAWMSALTAPQLLLVSLMIDGNPLPFLLEAGWRGYGSIIFMAILVTIVGYGIWYHLIPRYDVNQTIPFTLLVPPFGVFFGVWLLDEPLTWRMAVGGIATLIGVAIIILRRPKLLSRRARVDV